MKQEDTKQKILDKALELFSTQGYDSVSVGELAKAVGIKAPSLYNHFSSKQAIFDAIMESTAAQYEADTDKIDIHVQDVHRDIPIFTEITADALFEKVRQIFEYSLHNEAISRFRRMMTIEQFRSPELAALYSRRYVERVLDYHAGIFRALIAAGEITAEDLKINIGSAIPRNEQFYMEITGRNLITGLPKIMRITSDEITEALDEPLQKLLEAIHGVLEHTPAELVADIFESGLVLSGGGAQLSGLCEAVALSLKIDCRLADDPQECVARGCGLTLENWSEYGQFLGDRRKR